MRLGLLMDPHLLDFVLGDPDKEALAQMFEVDFDTVAKTVSEIATPETVTALLTGWGGATLTEADFEALENLKVIVHWGGGCSYAHLAAARGIALVTAREINAKPVAEFTLAMITLAAKEVFWSARRYQAEQRFLDRELEYGHVGLGKGDRGGAMVGIVGASAIGKMVIDDLVRQGKRVGVYDPTVTLEQAELHGYELFSNLTDLAAQSKILSIHAPEIPATLGLVSAQVLAALPIGATIINTARGAVVDQEALVKELQAKRLYAILDVAEPDVLPAGHPLYSLNNVFLTPHVAGSMGTELRDLGSFATTELLRFATAQAPIATR